LADRFGQHRVIPPLIGVHILAVTGLTIAVMAGTPIGLWLVLGVVAGLSGPNLGAMVRTRWAGVADGPDELTTAFALESTLDEVAFVLGPPLATALAVAIAPWSAIGTGLLLAGSGALALAAQRSTEPRPAPRTGMHGPAVWRSGILQLLTLIMVLMGAIFGAIEVSTVAFAQESDAVWATGWLLGVFALASGLTGLYLGARPGGWPLSTQVLIGTGTLALAAATIPFIDGLGGYAAGMFAAGLGVSAVMIGAMQIIERSLPRARLTEALALAISGVLIGSAGAVALSGALIDAGGSSWGLAVGSVAALIGLVVAALARPALARAESPAPADETGPDGSPHRAEALTTVPAAPPVQSGDGTAPPA
jgi:predicted MFS family arabinose efflux permease